MVAVTSQDELKKNETAIYRDVVNLAHVEKGKSSMSLRCCCCLDVLLAFYSFCVFRPLVCLLYIAFEHHLVDIILITRGEKVTSIGMKKVAIFFPS